MTTVWYLLAEGWDYNPAVGLVPTGKWNPIINGKPRAYQSLKTALKGREEHDGWSRTKHRIVAVTFNEDGTVSAEWV